ncbi:hypothetical protein AGMMS49992_10750 [Clostridia bacterium]|nr:hypothetical protein AGMMS49992_10750 [Clostridia bacterium]
MADSMRDAARRIRAATAALPMLRKQAADTVDEASLIDMAGLFPTWTTGETYKQGDILRHGAGLYRVMQEHTAQAHQKPDGVGMLAVYASVQQAVAPGQILDWASGETGLKVGDKRRDPTDGKVYEAIQSTGVNVWEPHTVPALWKVSA